MESNITILFGTQTGNSQEVSERIRRKIIRLRIKVKVFSLSDYSTSHLITEHVVIFVCSTTGDGEFPDNMKAFWKFLLRKDLPSNSLNNVNFCVFGLGDSSYDKFNFVAKKLNKRLLQLGAIEFMPLTLADDQHELGYDATLDPWIENLKENLINYYKLNPDNFIPDNVLLPPKYKVYFHSEDLNEHSISQYESTVPLATLISNERLTSNDHFQAVHLLKFKIDAHIKYQPGDVAVLRPENPPDEVNEFLSLFNIPLDSPFTLETTDKDAFLPENMPYICTVRQCAKSYFDIMSIPNRTFFEFFRHFSKDEIEAEKLFEFTTAVGQEELYDYCNRPRRTIVEVLKDFPHTTPHVPFEYLFDMVPCIRPRSFSIASSLRMYPEEFHLIVAVVEYKTRLKKPRKGLCSNWLANLPLGCTIPFNIKHGSIILPADNKPIIMIGPGTGCAPFRSFIQERVNKKIKDNYFFFGCRYKNKDFLCSNEWEELSNKHLLNIYTAFSRDQEEKVYVQHKIKENNTLIWNLINNKEAVIYIAGNAKQMPKDVKEAFLQIIKLESNLDESASETYLKTLQLKRRLQIETWA